jgi:hypothetical protein
MNQAKLEEQVEVIFKKLKRQPSRYDEKEHCKMILRIMLHKGRYSAFCTEALICESTFREWINKNPLFAQCYAIGKMFSRENWEIEGEQLREETNPPGVISHKFEHWKMMGWSRFGISKNSRIRLNLDPNGNPSQHYSQLLLQASEGDFTASEIKQLMEAVNVGLNTHQVFELQKEIDQLKSDLAIMMTNQNGNDTITDKRST